MTSYATCVKKGIEWYQIVANAYKIYNTVTFKNSEIRQTLLDLFVANNMEH